MTRCLSPLSNCPFRSGRENSVHSQLRLGVFYVLMVETLIRSRHCHSFPSVTILSGRVFKTLRVKKLKLPRL